MSHDEQDHRKSENTNDVVKNKPTEQMNFFDTQTGVASEAGTKSDKTNVSKSQRKGRGHIRLRESDPSDSEALNDFFSQLPIEGKVSLKIKRRVDFFSVYKKLGQSFVNFIFEKDNVVSSSPSSNKSEESITRNHETNQLSVSANNKSQTAHDKTIKMTSNPTTTSENLSFANQKSANNAVNFNLAPTQILGTASFLIRDRYLRDEKKKISFACDLRIANDRKVVMSWARHFTPTLEKLKNEHGVEHFMTTLNLTEAKAINAFLRPRTFDSPIPAYELVDRFNLASIHGMYPWFSHNKQISVAMSTTQDEDELLQYLNAKLNNYDLVPAEYKDDLKTALNDSLIYSLKGFLIARDTTGKIVGCAHPVHSSVLQDYFPMAYDSQATNFRQFLKFISVLGLGRMLTRPYSSTSKEQTLSFYLLHFLNADHPEILKSLIYAAYKRAQNKEFILYVYSKNDFRKKPPLGFIFANIPYGLYELTKRQLTYQPSSLKTTKPIFLDDLWF